MEIFKVISFDAAHRLPKVPPGHICARLHGHTYRLELHLRGKVGQDTGWVRDFGDIDKVFEPLHQQLEHNCLNDIPGLENPTSENLARWIWQSIKPNLPELHKIVVQENSLSGCIYCGEED
jgi:6-pyruvoyltetrahydropterin/6-carboxytetrahydropterin synthase